GPVQSDFLCPKRTTVDCNQSRTDPDIGGTGPDHLGPVFCSPRNQKRPVQTGFLVAMTKTELHLLKTQAKCNVTTIKCVMHVYIDVIIKIIWSYLSQFLTVFDEQNVKLKVIIVVTSLCNAHDA
ncbi:hypothetical protein K443DRAFT_99971, partial [Laccaria amethystina LaAM-08-1]